ncbi:TraB/VirB10 family protein, partial [Cupriavidus basilensis]
PAAMPPATGLPPPPLRSPDGSAALGMPPGSPAFAPPAPPAPTVVRVSLAERGTPGTPAASVSGGAAPDGASSTAAATKTISTFLPVSFTRGTLLGGLDAPTGGQSQANPHPVLIRLSDNSVLPNQFRGEYRDCFVIAAGYGDISSERAYLRTENLSCVRADGATLEVRIQGSVYGEDGKVGMRGRLVTKQGQMLANALLAGVVSGIGQGVSNASTSYSTSPLGSIATASGTDAYRAGLGSGVGKALDRLAQYYIKLAESTFPVIEVDAGREIDVVITKGVRIDVPMTAANGDTALRRHPADPETRYLEPTDDTHY